MRNEAKFGQAGVSGGWQGGKPVVQNKANLQGGEFEIKCLLHKVLGEKVRTVRR